jgi:hypothetical protein
LIKKRVEEGSCTHEVTQRLLPSSKGIAGVNMRLTAGRPAGDKETQGFGPGHNRAKAKDQSRRYPSIGSQLQKDVLG